MSLVPESFKKKQSRDAELSAANEAAKLKAAAVN